MSSQKSINGIVVEPGAVISHGPPRGLSFQVVAVCEESAPERWRGEVRFNGTAILQAEAADSYDRACRRAEDLLNERVIASLTP